MWQATGGPAWAAPTVGTPPLSTRPWLSPSRDGSMATTRQRDISDAAQEAHKSVAAAKREVKHVGKELQDAVVVLNDTLIKALSVAERENSTVYLQRIPPNPDLPKILPAAIVKPILLPGLADAQNESLFTSVIPDSR